ncbi:hypothetical protein CMI42_03475 [Candidatus Pacearchaeota archaeon]|nr:hypothetical protein [Candidatus Pacearchaeota archaeon]|tara:strand:- start:911 stop:1372 length:462 start_codon:yes stop_codon:yes gene_type:complete
MRRNIFNLIVIFVVLFFVFLIGDYSNGEVRVVRDYELRVDDNIIYLKSAITDSEKLRGLMYVDDLSDDEGMIFVYDDEDYRIFWMKNTLIPLDLIFLDSDLGVVDVRENFMPCVGGVCERYRSLRKARYVVEVNGGLSKDLEIEIEDVLDINI